MQSKSVFIKNRKNILKAIILIIVFLSYGQLFCEAYGENIMNSAQPSYKLGLIPSNYSTNKNTPIEVVIMASGGGKIEKAKILVYSDKNVKIRLNEQEEWSNVFIHVDKKVFTEEKDKYKKYLPDTFPLKSEFTDKIRAVELESAISGNHTVYFILSYTADDIVWHSDRLEFKFYVNSWLDNNLWWLTVLGVLIALVTLVTQTNFGSDVVSFLKRIFT